MQQQQQSPELKELIAKSKLIRQTEIQKVYKYPYNYRTGQEVFEKHKTIIFIGETGAGKTTLINFFLNYYLDVQYDDDFRFIFNDETESQAINYTKYEKIYFIKSFNGKHSLMLIEMSDRRIFEQMAKFQSLTQICFVIQASQSRLTSNQYQISMDILSLLRQQVMQNFSFIITFSDGKETYAEEAIKFDSPFANLIDKIKEPWCFEFNSSALFRNKKKDKQNQLKGKNQIIFSKRIFWNDAMENFSNLYNKISLSNDVSDCLTIDVLRQRERIKLLIKDLREQITTLLNKQANYQRQIRQVESLDKQTFESENFKVSSSRFVIKKVDIAKGQYSTNCTICNRTCHFPCEIDEGDYKNYCEAIINGFCTVCEKRCPKEQHKNLAIDQFYKNLKKTQK